MGFSRRFLIYWRTCPKYHSGRVETNEHFHLLDGQQRSTAIALGFVDVWGKNRASSDSSLWLDLHAPDENPDRQFGFRVLTKSHPWGYRLKPEANGSMRLPANEFKKASDKFRKASESMENLRATQFPINLVWPWDAYAPVPLNLLIRSYKSGSDIRKELLQLLQELPYWLSESFVSKHGGIRESITAALYPKRGEAKHFDRIVKSLDVLIRTEGSYKIPVWELDVAQESYIDGNEGELVAEAESSNEVLDPVETLFVRINSAGTNLGGEELIYSILKSIWPKAQTLVDGIKGKLSQPSRLISTISRVVLGRALLTHSNPQSIDYAPASPTVLRFRRLISGIAQESPEFKANLLAYLEDGSATKLMENANTLLISTEIGKDDFRLHPILAADIADRSPDVFYIFLQWLDKFLSAGFNVSKIPEESHRKMIGFLTTLNMFSENITECIHNLWRELRHAKKSELPFFFDEARMRKCFSLTKKRAHSLLPPVPPRILENILKVQIIEHRGIKQVNGRIWSNWNNFDNIQSVGVSRLEPSSLRLWYRRYFKAQWGNQAEEDEHVGEFADRMIDSAWSRFFELVIYERRLVLLNQQNWLREWFPDYDPTSPNHLDEINRPFDYDHILPSAFIDGKQNIPTVIRSWHNSIGNLRAWPLELNRSDSKDTPKEKLNSPIKAAYNLSSQVPVGVGIDPGSGAFLTHLGAFGDGREKSSTHPLMWRQVFSDRTPLLA